MRRLLLTIPLAWALVLGTAGAHDAKLHKGKPVEGEIVSIDAAKLELKTAAGVIPVTLSAKTKYEHENQTVTRSHLKKGARVSVFGTKLATGEMAAREILIGGAADHADHKK
jgi:hypothetical protein